MSSRRILLAVTSDVSITLMAGFPGYLAGKGWDVHVVSSEGPNSAALSEVPGVTVHALPMRRDPAPADDLRGLFAWIALLRRVKPSIISVGTPKAALLGLIAGLLTRTPTRVYMLRGLRYETTSGLGRQVFVAIERLCVACSHAVIAVSDSLKHMALADRLGRASKFGVIGAGSSNGVDLARFAVTDEERAHAQAERWTDNLLPVVGFVGRIHPDKGLDLLVDAVEVLAERGVNGRLLVVGGPDDPTGEELTARLRRLPWEVELTGPVGDVAPLLRVMDILCLPTKREGFPNVILEAAAAGIPTVATRATGVVDAVVPAATGLVVDKRDPDDLANALQHLIESATDRVAYGHAARNHVERLFSRQSVWDATEAFYARLAGRRC
jgi:glycosyltransferase involved in cell wall biosynthesis